MPLRLDGKVNGGLLGRRREPRPTRFKIAPQHIGDVRSLLDHVASLGGSDPSTIDARRTLNNRRQPLQPLFEMEQHYKRRSSQAVSRVILSTDDMQALIRQDAIVSPMRIGIDIDRELF